MSFREKFRTRVALVAVVLAFSGCDFGAPEKVVQRDLEGDPGKGETLLFSYGCIACHKVPGHSNYPDQIGPPLTEWSRRKYIAGRLPNQPEELVRWIRDPQAIEPGTAMPNLDVSESEARDIAAYLFSLE